MFWGKVSNPTSLFVCLLIFDCVYVPAWTKNQRAQFEESGSIGEKENLVETDADSDEVVIDTKNNCDNSTLYNIQMDFTSAVIENGSYLFVSFDIENSFLVII